MVPKRSPLELIKRLDKGSSPVALLLSVNIVVGVLAYTGALNSAGIAQFEDDS